MGSWYGIAHAAGTSTVELTAVLDNFDATVAENLPIIVAVIVVLWVFTILIPFVKDIWFS